MTKRRLIILAVLAAIMSVACIAFAACGGGKKHTITWDISNVTLEFEGYSEAPASLKEDTEVSFKVTPNNGYGDVKVTPASSVKLDKESGYYKFTVKGDMTVTVTASEQISSIEVTKNPEKLSYKAGETVDKTGMEVTVHYATGRNEVTDKYSIIYQNSEAGAFSAGDEYFTVSFGGKTAKVDLNEKIVAVVTLNAEGATIEQTTLDALEAAYGTVTVNEGVYSFEFTELKGAIILPVLTKGDAGDYLFLGWYNEADERVTEIAAETTMSVSLTAKFQVNLLNLKSISIIEDGGKPYLVINAEHKVATSVKVSFTNNEEGSKFSDSTAVQKGAKNDPVTIKYDLTRVSSTSDGKQNNATNGKWITVTIVNADNDKETQQIDLVNYESVEDFINMDQTVIIGKLSYNFATENPTDNLSAKMLRVYWADNVTTFTMTAGTDKDGNATVTFAGQITEPYMADTEMALAGKVVYIDWYVSSSFGEYGTIGQDGKWSVTFTLTPEAGFNLNTDGYAHFQIRSAEGGNTIYKEPTSNDGNLLNGWCKNEDLEIVNVGLIENRGAIVATNKDGTNKYYIGFGKWGGIVIYGKDATAVEVNKVGLVEEEGKAYAVFSGTYGNKTREELATYVIDGEVSGRVKLNLEIVEYNEDDGTFVMKADISGLSTGRNYMHAGFEAEPANLPASLAKVDEENSTITVGDVTYSFDEEWSCRQIVVS